MVDFLEFTGLVRWFQCHALGRGKQTRKPSRNYAGVVRDASECTIQQGKAVEGGEIPRFQGTETEELLELKSKGKRGREKPKTIQSEELTATMLDISGYTLTQQCMRGSVHCQRGVSWIDGRKSSQMWLTTPRSKNRRQI